MAEHSIGTKTTAFCIWIYMFICMQYNKRGVAWVEPLFFPFSLDESTATSVFAPLRYVLALCAKFVFHASYRCSSRLFFMWDILRGFVYNADNARLVLVVLIGVNGICSPFMALDRFMAPLQPLFSRHEKSAHLHAFLTPIAIYILAVDCISVNTYSDGTWMTKQIQAWIHKHKRQITMPHFWC